MTIHQYDFIVIGGGIIGINIANELKESFQDSSICILEKEDHLAEHASGRNSGVLHAGFYYDEDSIKAKFCRDGNKALTEYCLQKNITINRCGKLVVASDEEELNSLNILMARGKKNNVELIEIDEKDLFEIDPMAKTFQKAIFSPNTSTVSPIRLMQSMQNDAKKNGIDIFLKTKYLSRKKDSINTSKGHFKAKYIVNCAGLYADKIAKDFGFSKERMIIPFKGIYLKEKKPSNLLKTNIYPTPNLDNPFLGVHFTLTVDNFIKIGPTAIPAFWPEQYSGFKNFNMNDFLRITIAESKLFFKSDFDFKKLAFEEYSKMSKNKLIKLASKMVKFDLDSRNFEWSKAGIRAQLLNTNSHSLEMDFIYEGDQKSFHILNAVSPAWTCAIPFSKFIVKEINKVL